MENKVFQLRKKITCIITAEGSERSFEPVRIKSASKSADYSMNFTPFFEMTIQLSADQMGFIKKNQEKIIFKIKVETNKYINDVASAENKSLVESIVNFDKVFIPSAIESEDLANVREFPQHPETDDPEMKMTGGNDRALNLHDLTIYIDTLDYHLMYKKTFNTVLRAKKKGTKIDMSTVVKMLCENLCGSDESRGYILDPIDNQLPYENVIIPQGNAKYTLDILQTMYGIYLQGLLSFYELDGTLYVLNRLAKIHDYETGKPREVILEISTDKGSGNSSNGLVQYEDEIIRHVTYKGLEDHDLGIASGEAFGDTIIFTNFGMGKEVFTFEKGKLKSTLPPSREFLRDAISHKMTGKGVSYEYDELNNEFNMFSKLAELGVTATYLVEAENMDMNCLNPNVLFNINIIKNFNEEAPENDDNVRFKDKKFPIMSYNQLFIRDSDLGEYNVFRTKETIILANMKQ